MAITAVVVDDEPLARGLLGRLLDAEGVTVIGEATDGATALQAAQQLRPDLIFVDIEMPEMSGMEFAECVRHMPTPPLIVFVTGYSEHALAAFDHDALDYLLKPVSRKRLARTLIRARSRLEGSAEGRADESVTAQATIAAGPTLSRLPIRDNDTTHFLKVEDIIFAEARDRRVYVHTAATEFKSWLTLKYLEDRLPAERFLRVHDAFIVCVEAVDNLHSLGGHVYEISLSDGRRIPVGRSRYSELKRRLGVD